MDVEISRDSRMASLSGKDRNLAYNLSAQVSSHVASIMRLCGMASIVMAEADSLSGHTSYPVKWAFFKEAPAELASRTSGMVMAMAGVLGAFGITAVSIQSDEAARQAAAEVWNAMLDVEPEAREGVQKVKSAPDPEYGEEDADEEPGDTLEDSLENGVAI